MFRRWIGTAAVSLVFWMLPSAGVGHRALGGLPFFQKRPDSWFAARASDPVGARQKYYKGKYWPPYPRPTGEPLPWIHRFHAAHYWPYPYNIQDRTIVRDMTDRQVANGWMLASTLYEYHFVEGRNDLTRAGLLQLRWILENVPLEHRVIFVQSAYDNDARQARLNNVKTAAQRIVGEEASIPPVMLRVTSPLARPAEEVRQIRDAELKSQPKPRITDPIGSSSGGSESEALTGS